MRCTAVYAKRRQRAGVLGYVDCHGTHLDIIDATADIVERFCSSSMGVPRASKRAEVMFDEALRDHLLKTVHFFNADGESAEQRAGKKSRTASHRARPLFPNPVS